MFAVRHLPTKGLSVIATTVIQPGTRLLAEQPLISIPSSKPPSSLFTAIRHLTPSQIQTLSTLSPSPVKSSALLSSASALLHALHSLIRPSLPSSPSSSLPPSPEIQPFLRTLSYYPTLRRIFHNNNFLLTPTAIPSSPSSSSSSSSSSSAEGTAKSISQQPHQALFPQTSRFNHACVPNAQTNWNAATQRFTTHAVSRIAVGEEVCLSYLPMDSLMSREERREKLMRGYGFLCGCGACADGKEGDEMEKARKKWREKLRRFSEDEVEGERGEEGELRLTVEFARVYEELGIRGRELATVYLRIAELAKAVGDGDRFEEYAEKGLRVDEECLGKDNPVYGESVERIQSLRR